MSRIPLWCCRFRMQRKAKAGLKKLMTPGDGTCAVSDGYAVCARDPGRAHPGPEPRPGTSPWPTTRPSPPTCPRPASRGIATGVGRPGQAVQAGAARASMAAACPACPRSARSAANADQRAVRRRLAALLRRQPAADRPGHRRQAVQLPSPGARASSSCRPRRWWPSAPRPAPRRSRRATSRCRPADGSGGAGAVAGAAAGPAPVRPEAPAGPQLPARDQVRRRLRRQRAPTVRRRSGLRSNAERGQGRAGPGQGRQRAPAARRAVRAAPRAGRLRVRRGAGSGLRAAAGRRRRPRRQPGVPAAVAGCRRRPTSWST